MSSDGRCAPAGEGSGGLVLCGVDASDGARSAVIAAEATALRAGLPLLLAHIARDARDPGLEVRDDGGWPPRVVDYGMPGPRLLALADRCGAGLLVLGTRHLGRCAAVVRGSVSRHVARRARCPVMIVGRSADSEAPASGGHLVCGIETRDDVPVLEDAARLARRLGIALVVVHVLPPGAAGRRAAGWLLDGVLAEVDTHGAPVETRLAVGERVSALAATAAGAAAVVVGSRRGGTVFASTWAGLARCAAVPVIVRRNP